MRKLLIASLLLLSLNLSSCTFIAKIAQVEFAAEGWHGFIAKHTAAQTYLAQQRVIIERAQLRILAGETVSVVMIDVKIDMHKIKMDENIPGGITLGEIQQALMSDAKRFAEAVQGGGLGNLNSGLIGSLVILLPTLLVIYHNRKKKQAYDQGKEKGKKQGEPVSA